MTMFGKKMVLLISLFVLLPLSIAFAETGPKKAPAAPQKKLLKAGSINVTAFVIHASKEGEFVDDAIKPLVANLDALSFTSYKLIGRSEQVVPLKGAARFALPEGGGELVVSPVEQYLEHTDEGKSVEVIQVKAEMPALKTKLKIFNGATVLMGGIPFKEGRLFVALKAVSLPMPPYLTRPQIMLKRGASLEASKGLPDAPAASTVESEDTMKKGAGEKAPKPAKSKKK